MTSLPMVGEEFAGYRLRGVLGRGGMSVVYEAENPRLGSTVALKVLAPELTSNDVFRARFLQESRIAASLNHPNVIPIYDMGPCEDMLYIAMRYVSGSDLRAVLKARQRISPGQAVSMIGQAGRAIDAAHRHGLVHRDVKPGNILIERAAEDDDPDHVYLADFGITKHATSRSGLTATGEFVGTIDYIAPEQIQGKSVDGRADVYSLGCVLYECLSGRVPFVKDIDAAVIWAHVQEMPTPPSALRPELPGAIDDVVARALAKDPGDRYPTCRELVSAARVALADFTAHPHTILARRGDTASAVIRQPGPRSSGGLEPDGGRPLSGAVPSPSGAALSPSGALPPPAGAAPPPAGPPAPPAYDPPAPPAAGPPAPPPSGPPAPPAYDPPAPPAASPPASPGATNGRSRRRSRWLAATAAVAVLIIVAGVGIWLAWHRTSMSSMSSSSHSAAGPAASPLMRALAGANQTPPTGFLPANRCHTASSSLVTCTQPRIGVDTVTFKMFPSLKALYSAYEAHVRQLEGVTGKQPTQTNFKNCLEFANSGEVSWDHNERHYRKYTLSQSRAGMLDPSTQEAGRVFCTMAGGVDKMVWTQDAGLLLGVLSGGPHEDTWLWWMHVHHNIQLGSQHMTM